MRKIKSFLNIEVWRHVTVEAHNTNMNLKLSIICPTTSGWKDEEQIETAIQRDVVNERDRLRY